MVDTKIEDPWTVAIQKLVDQKRLTSHQCIVYNKETRHTTNSEKCGCQRPIRHHSFTGGLSNQKPKPDEWNVKDHTKNLEKLIYCSTPHQKFLRCSCENQTDIETLYELMNEVNEKPKLIISVYGGRKYFTMNENIEKEFMESMAEAAITPGTWVITSGLNNGAAKLIGEGIARLRALTYERQQVTLLGMAWWGNITEKTRTMVLGMKGESNSTLNQQQTTQADIPFSFNDNDSHALEKNHTHFFLFDDGKYSSPVKQQAGSSTTDSTNFAKVTKYPKEMQRSDFVTHACAKEDCFGVTVVVEGGINTCLAILNDIQSGRPVVLIQGSGKMSDIIASLMELTAKDDYTPARLPENAEIEHNLSRFPMRIRTKEERQKHIAQIREIMQPSRRMYLTVFRNNSERNLKQTILHAIFKAHYAQADECKPSLITDRSGINGLTSQKMHLLKLAIRWNCFDQATDLLEELQYINNPEAIAILFKQALDENRPAFIDFFLRINYDPRQTFHLLEGINNKEQRKSRTAYMADLPEETENVVLEYQHQCELNQQGLHMVLQLYQEAFPNTQVGNYYKSTTFPPHAKDQLDALYARWIGNFMSPLFRNESLFERLRAEMRAIIRSLGEHLCWCYPPCCTPKKDELRIASPMVVGKVVEYNPVFPVGEQMTEQINDGRMAEEGKQAMLRDLLYWAVFTDRVDMVRVLILHIRPRICAALTCSAILKERAQKTNITDKRHFYKQQALAFETYATDCIDACYSKSERKACEIMIREVPLFGKITCMQVAISARCSRFINTDCFNQVLNRIWFNKLAHADKSFFGVLKMVASLLTFGLPAPWLLSYRLAEDEDLIDVSNRTLPYRSYSKTNKISPLSIGTPVRIKTLHSTQLSYAGVNYWTRYTKSPNCTWQCYVKKFKHFHQSPMVKMCYHFASYIWLLLVFSYMILFKFDKPGESGRTYHWTEIYTIITISLMLIEDLRRTIFYYITNMRESKSHSWTSWVLRLGLQASPYALFYTGIIIWYVRGNDPSYLSIARIILALDLEFWYLISLKFVSAVKILGPKVFMVRNMLRDLCGFLYVAFICISAYGVVSRAMIKHGDVQFTASSIFYEVFYAPYWFLYSVADDEKRQLDGLISNSSSNLATEAVATHVLLAFHMVFINILLLNLLIAVFATTINRVENNTKYFWRYQRYKFIQEYFEKPVLPAPPVIFFCYLLGIVRYIYVKVKRRMNRHNTTATNKATISGIFKMIPVDPIFTERCTAFEHAATYDYARLVAENNKDEKTLPVHK